MKEPSSCRFRKKPAATKLKLVCSFNGAFHVRPPSNKLRYIGGETRIVSVDRTVSFSKLRSKISDICPNAHSFSIKYHLLVNHNLTNNPDDDGNPLVLIASDDDVRCMVEEYDKLELYGKHARIWVYLCSECEGNKSCSNNNDDNHTNGIVKENYDDDSLRKKVLKQQLLAQQNKKYEKPLIDLDLGPDANVSVIKNDPFRVNIFNATGDGRLRPLNPRNGNVASVAVGQDASAKWLMRQSGEGWHDRGGNTTGNSGQSLLPLKGVYNCGAVLKRDSLDGKQDVRNMEPMWISNFNRENIMPWAMSRGSMNNHVGQLSCSDQWVGSVYPVKSSHVGNRDWGDCQNGTLSDRFGVNHTRYQRIYPYYLRNQGNNLVEGGSQRGVRLNGKIRVGKCYIGIRPISSIAKHGQSLGSYNPYTLNPWPDFSGSTVEGEVNMSGSFSNEGCYSFEVQCSPEKFREQGGPATLQYGNSNLEESHLAYQVTCSGVGDQSSVSCTRTPSSFVGVMNTWEDLLTGSNVEKHEVQCSALHENFHEIPMNCEPIHCYLQNEKILVDSQENGNISDLSNDMDCRNGTSLGCSMENGTKNSQDQVASSMDLLYNLSLSSAKEMDPLHNSSFTSNDISDLLLKQQSKPLDPVDEGKFMTGPTVNESKTVASKSSFHNAATGRIDVHKEEIQLDPPSDLSLENKVNTKKSHLSSKVIGGISCTLIEFCIRVSTGELQTIKASDLEYIKELGSGTFGTVFYGKWKGSDVAIKRMKPSCFTEGSLEEDRMVADFWREARMLAQLHHPNVVAFYGVVSDGPVMNLATVTEYMVNGSLKQVLWRRDRTIDRRKRLIIAMDAAFGMEYLHEKKIVHFDLKSHNLLVNMRDPQRPVCKIGDLGLSKIKQKTLISGGVRGTLPWMAPELLNSNNNLVTEKIDVYSFGVVMWELLTGEEPYADLHSEEIIAGIIKGSLRPEIPSWCDPSWRSLMERCWSSDHNFRPGFSEIAKELRAMAAAMNIK